LFSAALISALIFGFVAINALLVQTTYRMQTVQREVMDLQGDQKVLVNQVATLSSPIRVAAWAQAHRMVMPGPGETVILAVPDAAARSGSAP
jgi:cell division protein FtsL